MEKAPSACCTRPAHSGQRGVSRRLGFGLSSRGRRYRKCFPQLEGKLNAQHVLVSDININDEISDEIRHWGTFISTLRREQRSRFLRFLSHCLLRYRNHSASVHHDEDEDDGGDDEEDEDEHSVL